MDPEMIAQPVPAVLLARRLAAPCRARGG